MLKKTLFISSFLIVIYEPTALASWNTNSYTDIFTGTKNSELIAEINNKNQSVRFNCLEGKLTFSQVQEDQNTIIKGIHRYDILFRAGDNAPVTFDTTLSRRNPKSIQLTSTQQDQIRLVLKQLQSQSSGEDFLIGVTNKNGTRLSSGAGSMAFAKTSIKRFITACKITL